MEDKVLYRVEPDSTLRVIPPVDQHEKLFQKAHSGVFKVHLSGVKVYNELRRHYWWSGMRSDIMHWTRGSLVCATRSTGRATCPPLTPIPVAGPFGCYENHHLLVLLFVCLIVNVGKNVVTDRQTHT